MLEELIQTLPWYNHPNNNTLYIGTSKDGDGTPCIEMIGLSVEQALKLEELLGGAVVRGYQNRREYSPGFVWKIGSDVKAVHAAMRKLYPYIRNSFKRDIIKDWLSK